MRPKNQSGLVHLGIIGLIVLIVGLFVASKLVSNPDLTFFNISEEAAGNRETCRGCLNGKQRRWDQRRQVCLEKKSSACSSNETPKTSESRKPKKEAGELCRSDSECLSNECVAKDVALAIMLTIQRGYTVVQFVCTVPKA